MLLSHYLFFFLWLTLGIGLSAQDSLANMAHEILSNQTDQERNETLTVLINQSQKDCDVVVENFFQGLEPEGGALWNAACANGKSFAILIEDDERGSTRIMDCALVKSLTKGKSRCFKKLK